MALQMFSGRDFLLNLDTELDYYHSDGRTDFVGHRDTRTHIKDVSMGAGSSTSFGLMNLRDRHEHEERENDLQNLMVDCAVYGGHSSCDGYRPHR